MTGEGCEGLANYATFGVAVTLDNDRSASQSIRALCQWAATAVYEDGSPRPADVALADALKDLVESLPAIDDAASGATAGALSAELSGLLRAGLVRAGLAEVDWLDLARHFLRRSE